MSSIFISYSHKDTAWKEQLETHLQVLAKQNLLTFWEDQQIQPGSDWYSEIQKALSEAKVAILLISADFLSSNFILEEEIPKLLQRRQTEGVTLIPVLLRACSWKHVDWLAQMGLFPKDGKPISGKRKPKVDQIWTELVDHIVERLNTSIPDYTQENVASLDRPTEQIYLSRLPTTDRYLFGRNSQINALDCAWTSGTTHIVALVAWGGVGKTALVNRWLNRMEADSYRGAKRAYGWSFYSQGTSEDRQASADEFLYHALRWFGDPDSAKGAPWDKGVRLANLIRKQPTLLILDGLEPLQYPTGEMQGCLRDQGMQALLKELSRANPGLCVISTRVAIADLAHVRGDALQEIELEHLSEEAGAALLQHLGVQGTEPERRNTSEAFGGHALALNLLGRYLKVVHDGDIRKQDLIPHLTDEEKKGGHAKRVMRSYEIWLQGQSELKVLYLMGLFDCPVPGGAIKALLKKPVIPGLTDLLLDLPAPRWKYMLQHLRDLRLLAGPDSENPEALDAHPLLREYFSEQLQTQHPQAWKTAHSRLFDYYRHLPKKEKPDTLNEMAPLFAAVAHGCQTGEYQTVLDDVYCSRILRDGETSYCVKGLGAIGADLVALSHFFEQRWTIPIRKLDEDSQSFVLNSAGFRLRALGRLQEAVEPLQAGVDTYVEQKALGFAARVANNISDLYLIMGDISRAIEVARQSVEFADLNQAEGAWDEQILMRTVLANALHQSGAFEQAKAFFQEAESILQVHLSKHRFLHSVWGFHFCDFLLSQGKIKDVLKRAETSLTISQNQHVLLDIALAQLSLGKTTLLQTLSELSPDFAPAHHWLHQAVASLRKANMMDYLPYGLFARTALFRHQRNFIDAWHDLEAVREVVERNGMRLFLTDYHLEAGRLCLAEGNREAEAKVHWEAARTLIDETGYHRRDAELAAFPFQ